MAMKAMKRKLPAAKGPPPMKARSAAPMKAAGPLGRRKKKDSDGGTGGLPTRGSSASASGTPSRWLKMPLDDDYYEDTIDELENGTYLEAIATDTSGEARGKIMLCLTDVYATDEDGTALRAEVEGAEEDEGTHDGRRD